MASKRTPFQLRSGNSPLKTWGAVGRGLMWGGKKFASLYSKATVPVVATQTAIDKRKNMSTVGKALDHADDWVLGGLGKMYMNRNETNSGVQPYDKNSSKKVVNNKGKNGKHLYAKKSLQ